MQAYIYMVYINMCFQIKKLSIAIVPEITARKLVKLAEKIGESSFSYQDIRATQTFVQYYYYVQLRAHASSSRTHPYIYFSCFIKAPRPSKKIASFHLLSSVPLIWPNSTALLAKYNIVRKLPFIFKSLFSDLFAARGLMVTTNPSSLLFSPQHPIEFQCKLFAKQLNTE